VLRHRGCSLVVAAVFVVALSLAGLSQGFGSSGTFGDTLSERQFQSPTAQGEDRQGQADRPYFVHDQLTKFLLLLGFSIAALTILATRRFLFRKWLLLASVAVLGFGIGGVLCPISAVQNVFVKADTAYLLLFLVPVVLALLAGRIYCGYVCPFGALQELLHASRLAVRIPERLGRLLSGLKYGLLVYLIARILIAGTTTLDNATPFKAFFVLGGTPSTLAVGGTFVLLSLVLFRPFCQIACPLGAMLSILSRFSLFRVRSGAACVSCGKCHRTCPAGAMTGGQARPSECLLCGQCIRSCPTTALLVSLRSRRAKAGAGSPGGNVPAHVAQPAESGTPCRTS